MNISYINILQTIESFASAHLQIKKFASDFPAQMPNFATKNEEYPILFVSPTNSIFQENTNRYEIDVYCFDIIQSDRENINTILSDTNLILNDLNRWMLDGELFGIDNVSTSEATPIDNSLLDYAAGWVMRMTFETDTYGICEIPFSDSPVVITEVNNIVYSKYLTCETLSECQTIIDIQNELSGLTGTVITRTSQLINDGEDGTNPFVDTIDLATKFNNPTGTTNEYILGNGSLAPISGITSLVKNITPDAYLGLRLTPTDAANNGFYINKSINGAIGYYARNTDNIGNGAVAALTVGGTGGLYENYASFFHANDGYFVPYLRGKNGINTNNDFFFVGWQGSSFDFRTGIGSYGTETSKFKISSGGTLTIGVQPTLDNSVTDLLARKSDGTIVRVDKSAITSTDVYVTGGTYSNGTSIFTNNTGGTFSVTGFSTATNFTGGTVSGATIFTNGLTATTISATTYQNLPIISSENGIYYFNDFLGVFTTSTNDGNISSDGNISPVTTPPNSDANKQGFANVNTTTASAGVGNIYIGHTWTSAANFILGGGVTSYETLIWLPILSTSGERFSCLIGFSSGVLNQNNSLNNIAFLYDEGNIAFAGSGGASANWRAVTTDSGTRTFTDTGVAVNAGAFIKLKIVVNANASSVGFYIDNTLVATHTTNIPSGTSKRVSVRNYIQKSVGYSQRQLILDYVKLQQTFTTAR